MADAYIDKVDVGAKIQIMCIRREMDYGGENDFCRGMRKALRVIEKMPAADVQPVKHGKWIITDDVEQFIAVCSACGRTEDSRDIKDMPYCHCGARMDGEQNG